jgi:hypothetical protein
MRSKDAGLKITVYGICTELRRFNIKDILYVMTERQYPFEGDDLQKSVGNVLRALSRRGLIKLTASASGLRPAQYEI